VASEASGAPDVPAVADLTKVVALDGPAGSGKSTVARLTAAALGWRFVDTGATYRAVTLHALRAGVDLADDAAVAAVASAAEVQLVPDPSSPRVLLGGEDVSSLVRGADVTAAVSRVSSVPAVRERMVVLQRRLMGRDGAVVEGRDIATVVAPRAGLKVYLDARPEVRAQRRADEGTGGARVDLSSPEALAQHVAAVQQDLLRRDALDNQTNRLEASDGAVHLDTSDLSLDQVVAEVVRLARAAGLTQEGPGQRPGTAGLASEPAAGQADAR
jgi:cytidylate kinase